MLSPGQWYKLVERDQRKNLEQRKRVLEACLTNAELRDGFMYMCARDIRLWVSLFVWQFNPKRIGSEVEPFIAWDWQDADDNGFCWLLENIENQEDAVVEKSREMGATWMALIVHTWLCLFHGNKKFSALSHTELAVDRADDAGSLFWKVAFIIKHLPDWMLKGMRREKMKRKMGIAFPATQSSINGSASTTRSGVGGRDAQIFCDEFAKQKDAYDVESQTADTGPRLFVSTHYDAAGCYYDLTRREGVRKKVWHWSIHPQKNQGLYHCDPQGNITILDQAYYADGKGYEFVRDGLPRGGPFPGIRSPWYDKECKRPGRNSRSVAMHLDIDPQGSAAQVFNAELVRRLRDNYCRDPDWEGALNHDWEIGVPAAFNPLTKMQGGKLRLWFSPGLEGNVPAARYTIGVDPSTGSGATPSCMTIFNCRTGERCGEYIDSNLDERRLAGLAVSLCRHFKDFEGNPAWLIWEIPGPGITFGNFVVDTLNYRRVFTRSNEKTQDLRVTISDRPGWVNNGQGDILKLLLAEYESALESMQFINRSDKALEECLSFKFNEQTGQPEHPQMRAKNDPGGTRRNHGDRVIADALAWKMARVLGITEVVKKDPDVVKPGSFAWRKMMHENRERQRLEL